MLICVLKHTPGVFTIFNENDTIYSGLEVEVLIESHTRDCENDNFNKINL